MHRLASRARTALVVLLATACGTAGSDRGRHTSSGPDGEAAGGGGAGSANAGEPRTTLDLSALDPDLLAFPAPAGVTQARAQAAEIVATLTLDQKSALLHGSGGGVVGGIGAVGPLPALSMDDGPGGVANLGGVTAFPDPITLAATWDRELVERFGAALGAEERDKGVAVALAPMMNLSRSAQGGRNFEGFGEDPYLSAELAAQDVVGIQSNGIVATAKHFVGNEQETNRTTESSVIDERTLHEIYYPPFEASVSAGVGAVMCSYNRINGTYACDDPTTLGDLKDGFGFSGWVMTDWGAAHSAQAALSGLDMEMPNPQYFEGADLTSVPMSRIDDMATRIVTSLLRVGVVDDPPTGSSTLTVTSTEHSALARQAATEAITLLKNDGAALPFGADVSSILVLGQSAESALTTGSGSGAVIASNVTSPLAAITNHAGSATSVSFGNETSSDAEIASAASAADAVVIVIGVPSGEGFDRPSLALTDAQNALIASAARENARTVVVLDAPGAVLMPWLDTVSALVVGWYPGEENGNALAAVLFGDVSPSGKLPVTFPRDEGVLPVPSASSVVSYSEGLAVGYREFDALGVDPLFEFGFGLSYTTFAYDGLELQPNAAAGSVDVSFDLTNTGDRAGAEISELYLSFPNSAEEPPRVLRGFERSELQAGETERVHVELPARAFACWDPVRHAPFVPSGTYTLSVGSSSRRLPLTASLDIVGL
jgi:beta-glucosidase